MHYGGQVTDRRDFLCLKYLLADFMTPSIMDEKYAFTTKEIYHYPTDGGLSMDSYLNKLPVSDAPELVGVHESVKTMSNRRRSRQILEMLNALESSGPVAVPNMDYSWLISGFE